MSPETERYRQFILETLEQLDGELYKSQQRWVIESENAAEADEGYYDDLAEMWYAARQKVNATRKKIERHGLDT